MTINASKRFQKQNKIIFFSIVLELFECVAFGFFQAAFSLEYFIPNVTTDNKLLPHVTDNFSNTFFVSKLTTHKIHVAYFCLC